MNVLLWVVQAALALLCLSGGAFKIFKYDELAKVPSSRALPRGGWAALGGIEMSCAVLLIVPLAVDWMPMLTPLAAVVLAVENLGLAASHARYSRKLTAANPLVWALAIAVLAIFVAYGRYTPVVPV